MEPIIQFKEVSKSFTSLHKLWGIKSFLFRFFSTLQEIRHSRFEALKEVSFEIFPGERVGFIGPNGAGKSTILSLMAGVLVPTEGEVIVRGRVSPLLELGSGFHPELTGRENIFLNGILLGMTKKEVKKKFQSIWEFSELGSFIDQPIRTYSSGMMVRLGFSIAIHMEPEILLIDEVLAVGDAHFQQKSFQKIMEFKEEGVTMVLVSHALDSIQTLCDKVIWIERGRVMEQGEDVQGIIGRYQEKSLGGCLLEKKEKP